jgi:hypothetical protein
VRIEQDNIGNYNIYVYFFARNSTENNIQIMSIFGSNTAYRTVRVRNYSNSAEDVGLRVVLFRLK